MKNNLAIIGGGAAGLIAAITAARTNKNLNITVYERLARVGKKILATGNGRCNLTNMELTSTHYHGNDVGFTDVAFTEFGIDKTLNFWHELGLLTKTENNKVYPYSLQAGSVVDLLRAECDRLNITFKCEQAVTTLHKQGDTFLVCTEPADAVIIACGGKASPHLGSDGSGYALLTAFGHSLTPLTPAITAVKTDTTYVKQLKGIKTDANVTVFVADKKEYSTTGEVLFTEYGLSGPPILESARIAGINANKIVKISIDLMPEYSITELSRILNKKATGNNLTLEEYLTGILNKRLGQVVLKYANFALTTPISALTNKDIDKIGNTIKNFTFPVTGVCGFQNAQVTAGGIKTADFNNQTLESTLCKNLYAAGEILDIDGDCGGWNLQWAWSSGYLAGKSAAIKLMF